MDNVDAGEALQAESISATNVLDINIKTMDSRIYPLRVHNQMSVGELKQNVASATGVLTHHQRLLYGGRALRDDLPLSHYNIRDGHTVHLVARQPGPPSSGPGRLRNQPDPAAVTSDSGSSRALQATEHDTTTRTVNIPGYRNMSDIARALSTFIQGTGNSRAGQMNVPDAMTTMFRSVRRMRNNYHAGGQPSEYPLALVPAHVDPTVDALVVLLIATRRLLYSTAEDTTMLSATLMVTSSNSQLRQAIQAEAHRFAAQLVDMGAFFLELGRVTATLQMNGSRPEAVVSSGPATFITSIGPHPNLFQRVNAQQPGTSSGAPSSSAVQPTEAADHNVGSTSSRQPAGDDSNPRDSRRQRRE